MGVLGVRSCGPQTTGGVVLLVHYIFVELFHGLYCSDSMCVGVTLRFGWGGVVSVCRLRH